MSILSNEQKLFRESIGAVRRIHSDRTEFPRKKIKINIRPHVHEEELDFFIDMMSDELMWSELDSDSPMHYLKTGYDKRMLKRIEQGKIKVMGTIDLHGLTLLQARNSLSLFLSHSLRDGRRFIKIIHGQGYHSQSGPILRTKVNEWLRLRDEVLAFANPPIHQGGRGATISILNCF